MAGGGSSRGSGGKKKARIEIIPLIDVIFFLLATFVLFTLSLNKTGGVRVSLPPAEISRPRDTAGTATISVTLTGDIGWNRELVTPDVFVTNLQVFYAENGPEGRILVNGDENASYNRVFAYVVNEIRKAGFVKVFFETKSGGAKSSG